MQIHFRMDCSNGHNNQCSNHVFRVYAYCHHCSTVHEVPHRLGSTMLSLSNSSLSNTSKHDFAHHHLTAVNNKSTIFQGDDDMHDNNEISNKKVVDNDSNCLLDSSDINESSSFLKGTSTHGDSKIFFNGLNGHKLYYNSSQDKIGFIPHSTDDIPVPPQFQIPSSCKLNMSTHELELMLFINENFLSTSIFDKVMKWARSASANGYKFDAPSYYTLKKQIDYTFPNTFNGGALKSKVVFIPEEVGSDLPVTMWYFEQSFGVVCKVPPRSSSNEGLFFRGNILIVDHVCTLRLLQLTGSMKHSTIHLPLKVQCSGQGTCASN